MKTIKNGSVEVAEKDLGGSYTWDEAMAAVVKVGYGWRLPTKDELSEMYQQRGDIGGFTSSNYWSSSKVSSSYAWLQGFPSGVQTYYYKYDYYHVRAVRDVEGPKMTYEYRLPDVDPDWCGIDIKPFEDAGAAVCRKFDEGLVAPLASEFGLVTVEVREHEGAPIVTYTVRAAMIVSYRTIKERVE